jgi:hypothetical protein
MIQFRGRILHRRHLQPLLRYLQAPYNLEANVAERLIKVLLDAWEVPSVPTSMRTRTIALQIQLAHGQHQRLQRRLVPRRQLVYRMIDAEETAGLALRGARILCA